MDKLSRASEGNNGFNITPIKHQSVRIPNSALKSLRDKLETGSPEKTLKDMEDPENRKKKLRRYCSLALPE